jgi:hypothetical protein
MDESCISKPKTENVNWTLNLRFPISVFGFEMQDSSIFKFPELQPIYKEKHVC